MRSPGAPGTVTGHGPGAGKSRPGTSRPAQFLPSFCPVSQEPGREMSQFPELRVRGDTPGTPPNRVPSLSPGSHPRSGAIPGAGFGAGDSFQAGIVTGNVTGNASVPTLLLRHLCTPGRCQEKPGRENGDLGRKIGIWGLGMPWEPGLERFGEEGSGFWSCLGGFGG